MPKQSRPWRRGGGPWYSQVNGVKVWLAPGSATKGEAQEELYRVLAERGKATPRVSGRLTAKELMNLYLESAREAVGRGERTQGSYDVYEYHLAEASKEFGSVAATGLLPMHVLDWVNGRKTWCAATRATGIKIMKGVYRWAKKVGHLKVNPLAEMASIACAPREAVPTVEQAAAIVGAFKDQEIRDVLIALQETGCRPGEVYSLSADRVDLAEGTWRVRDKVRKATGSEFRTVYLTDRMIAMSRRLVALHPEGPIFRNTKGRPWRRTGVANRLWRMARKKGMGRETNAYANRHLFATQALVNGVPVATVATLLGHRRTTMVMGVYSRLAREAEHLREAVRKATGEGS